MKYVLDTNVLLAAILRNHPNHALADTWIAHKELVACPLSELGFLRISTNPKAYNVSMPLARQSLETFLKIHQVQLIPADLPGLKCSARSSDEVTDCYLAELAASRGMRLATLDERIAHSAAEVIR